MLSPKKTLALATLGFCQCSIFLLPYIQNVFYKPMMEALGINNSQLGFLLTIYGTLGIICYLPGGFLADRLDRKKLIIASVTATGIFALICAFFMNYHVYVVIWILMAIVQDLVFWSATMGSVRLVGNSDEQGKAYGYFYFFNNGLYAVSGFITVAILAHFTSEVVGIKYIILFFAFLNFASALLLFFLLPSTKQLQEESGEVVEEEEKATVKEMLAVLKYKETWFFAIMAFVCYSMYNVVFYFTPYFTDVMGLSVASAGLITVITGGPFTALISPLAGTFCDWMGSVLKTIMVCLALVGVAFLSVLMYTGTLSLAFAIAITAIIFIVATAAYTMMFASLEETGWDRKLACSVIGIGSIIGYAPDTFMYTLFGYWLDNFGNDGYAKIFMYSVALCIVGVISAFLLHRSGKKTRKDAELVSNVTENIA